MQKCWNKNHRRSGPERAAQRAFLEKIMQEQVKEWPVDSTGWLRISELRDRCRIRTTSRGSLWDLDLLRMIPVIVGSLRPDLLDYARESESVTRQQHKNTERALLELHNEILGGPVLRSFRLPVFYDWDDEDKPAYRAGYPAERLYEIEQEYLDINGPKSLAGDQNEPVLPLRTYLEFETGGKYARFVFTATKDYREADHTLVVQGARDWLLSQISDGFAEDMVRHEILVGNTVLTPYFDTAGLAAER